MAQGKKLTKAQKAVVEKLHSVGQLGLLDVIGQPRDNLYDAGIIEWVETTSDDGYFQLTTAGQALAVSLFGSNAPADTVTPTPETVASAAPVAANDTESPVADADIPFASFDSESTSDNATMPSIPAYTPDSVVSDTVEVLSSVKAPKAPVMTKKERRKQKQAELRAAYAIRQREQQLRILEKPRKPNANQMQASMMFLNWIAGNRRLA